MILKTHLSLHSPTLLYSYYPRQTVGSMKSPSNKHRHVKAITELHLFKTSFFLNFHGKAFLSRMEEWQKKQRDYKHPSLKFLLQMSADNSAFILTWHQHGRCRTWVRKIVDKKRRKESLFCRWVPPTDCWKDPKNLSTTSWANLPEETLLPWGPWPKGDFEKAASHLLQTKGAGLGPCYPHEARHKRKRS